MNKIVKVALGATLLLALGTTTVNADTAKGQKLYSKKLKKACGFSGAVMAGNILKMSGMNWVQVMLLRVKLKNFVQV